MSNQVSVYQFPERRSLFEIIADNLRGIKRRHIVDSEERRSIDGDVPFQINHIPQVTLQTGYVHPAHERNAFTIIEGNPNARRPSRIHYDRLRAELRVVEGTPYAGKIHFYRPHRRSQA